MIKVGDYLEINSSSNYMNQKEGTRFKVVKKLEGKVYWKAVSGNLDSIPEKHALERFNHIVGSKQLENK